MVKELADEAPTHVGEDRIDPLVDRVRNALVAKPWVDAAEVRLRMQGHVFTGEGYVVVRDETDLNDRTEEAAREIESMDWRLHEFSVSPVRELP